MLELLTGAGLAVSAGLNAYIPLLAIGLSARFLDFITLPAGWAWLENPWILGIIGFLLVIEIIADKIPVVDSFNDWLQTIVRPTAGGLAFGSGSNASTFAVTDPAAFFSNNLWVPIVLGVLIALVVHLTKAIARPVVNVATVGVATPIVSAAEDAGSIVVSVLALLAPIVIILVIPVVVWMIWWTLRRRKRRNGRLPKESTVSTV
ncbi:MAG: DUF4126 domain-containing protein [Terrimesophilobacter sp.]